MKRKILSMVLTLCMVISLMPGLMLTASATSTVWDGSVSTSLTVVDPTDEYNATTNPLAVSSGADLAYLAQQVNADTTITYTDVTGTPETMTADNASYKLTDDIVLNDTADWQTWSAVIFPANEWTPIGNDSNKFLGSFDGGGHTVSGIYINQPAADYQGLFGFVFEGTVKNVGVIESFILGQSRVGGVAGVFDGIAGAVTGAAQNCFNAGTVSGSDKVGGVIGGGYAGMTENCYNTGSVSGSSQYVGGVIGYSDVTGLDYVIQNCYNTGSVSGGSHYVGGVIGYHNSGTIRNCYNKGSVSGSGDNVGGVAGSNGIGLVQYSYNTGGVIGGNNVGGVVGYNRGAIQPARTEYSFNTGSVSGSNRVGGVVGYNHTANQIATTQYSYNTGSVSGSQYVGGVVGYNQGVNANPRKAVTQYSYNAGSVSGGSNAGGVVGSNNNPLWVTITGSFYDRQMCPVGGVDGADTADAAGKLTAEMLGAALQDVTPDNPWGSDIWVFAAGLYPRAAGTATTDAACVSAAPVKLYDNTAEEASDFETITAVKTSFTVGTANGVAWESSDTDVIDIDEDDAAVTRQSADTPVALTATKGSVSKTVVLTVLQAEDITSASVTGLTAPAAGAVPIAVGALTAGDASYTVTSITWQNGDGSAATLVDGKFKAASIYQAEIVLTSAAGYKFQAGGLTPAVNAGTAGAGAIGGGDVERNTLTFTVTFDATAQPGTLAFSSAAYSVAENGGSITITVNRGVGSDGAVTVDYATSNGTATAGSDYTAASGTLSFADGETSQTFSVSITDDAVYEGGETVNLTLSNPTGGADLGTSAAVLTITDDEVPAPGAPTILSAVPGDSGVYISWDPVAGATGYQVFSSTTSGSYGAALDTVAGAVYGYDVIGLTNGTTYYFVVNASNPGGASGYSNEVSATPQVPAPGAPTIQSAVAGDAHVVIAWDSVAGADGYKIYLSTTPGSYGAALDTVAGAVYGYDATGLANGTTYYFVVKASNPGGDSGYSNEVGATPGTVPGAPTGVTAAAGNGEAAVSFNPPADNGGSAITGYTVTSSPGNITVTGAGAPLTVTGLSNGTAYTFTVTAANAAGTGPASAASNAVTPHQPSSGDSGGSNTPSTPAPTAQPANPGAVILVNGKPETAATATNTREGDRTVTTVVVDDKKVEERLEQEGSRAIVTIPVSNSADVVIGTLNGQTVKNMENMEAVLEIRTENVAYTLPAAQINIDAVSEQIGKQVELKDIAVSVKISEPAADTVRIVEDAANKNNYQIMVSPVEFEITCSSGDQTLEVSRFNVYVERLIAIPEGVDPARITTAVVLNSDGTLSPVPMAIVVIDGRYYAKISSLTNSAYALISSPKTFKDLENHWAREAVDDMASRLVLSGVGEDRFEPDRDITRAEFAAIVIRALGLTRPGTGRDAFGDIVKGAYYYDAVSTAHEYGIVSGYGNGDFGPDGKITREQAMSMIARAMKLTGLEAGLTDSEVSGALAGFTDADSASAYAKTGISACVKAGIVSGRTSGLIAPKDNITRAEAAVMVRSLLQKSGLI